MTSPPSPSPPFACRGPLLRERLAQVDAELPQEQLGQGAAVAQVDPVSRGRALLLGLALVEDDVVVALGAGHGARQPDLLVRGLFVDHVGTDVGERRV